MPKPAQENQLPKASIATAKASVISEAQLHSSTLQLLRTLNRKRSARSEKPSCFDSTVLYAMYQAWLSYAGFSLTNSVKVLPSSGAACQSSEVFDGATGRETVVHFREAGGRLCLDWKNQPAQLKRVLDPPCALRELCFPADPGVASRLQGRCERILTRLDPCCGGKRACRKS